MSDFLDLRDELADGELLRRSGADIVGITPAAVVSAGAGYVAGGTDVAVEDGGTGASTASGARTNLGLAGLAVKDTVTIYHDIYWTFPTTAVQGDALKEVPAPRAGTIVEVEFSAGIAPTAASIIGDLTLDGASAWATTTANRPTIATSEKVGTGGTPDTTSFAAGTMLQPVLDQLNATDDGSVGQILVRLTWSETAS